MERSYKEKYEQALAHAREIHRNEEEKRRDMEFLFPELAESEDEKARKAIMALIEWSKSYSASGITNDDAKKMLAWLEKQGKTSPVLSNSANIGKDEQKQEWSEEDKDFMYDTLSNLTELKDRYGEGYGNVGRCIGWLKSLRPQNRWKPSDEQLTALRRMRAAVAGEGEIYKPLNSLYEDLMKLNEEE